jgi:hypothetical protein
MEITYGLYNAEHLVRGQFISYVYLIQLDKPLLLRCPSLWVGAPRSEHSSLGASAFCCGVST